MKTRIMKHLLRILPATVFAAALMQLYCAHMELKYNYEALAWREKCQTDQLGEIIGTGFQRTHRDAQKIAELEGQIKALTAKNGQAN
jgi:hypothetical protein